jgi:hypothetical protein
MYGTPVISNNNFTTQMPEAESIVPGHTGEFFEDRSIDSLVEVLLTFHDRFPDRNETRRRCFRMIDEIYNPRVQAAVMLSAVLGEVAPLGNDAFLLFDR